MALQTTIRPQSNNVAGAEPSAGAIEQRSIVINTADGKMWTKHTDNTVTEMHGRQGGSNTQVQFNDSTYSNGSVAFTFDKTANAVFVANSVAIGNTTATKAGLSVQGEGDFSANVTTDDAVQSQNGYYDGNSNRLQVKYANGDVAWG